MQSYIRPLYEGSFDLRALMKSALPLLITTPASKGPCRRSGFGEAGLTYRVIHSIPPRIVRAASFHSCSHVNLFTISVKHVNG